MEKRDAIGVSFFSLLFYLGVQMQIGRKKNYKTISWD